MLGIGRLDDDEPPQDVAKHGAAKVAINTAYNIAVFRSVEAFIIGAKSDS